MAREIKAPETYCGGRQFYLSFGEVEFSEDEGEWSEDSGDRICRHGVDLGEYAPLVPPHIIPAVVKAETDGEIGWSVEVEPFHSWNQQRIPGRFALCLRIKGRGHVQALRVQWTALVLHHGTNGG